jgi:hypothetical protein
LSARYGRIWVNSLNREDGTNGTRLLPHSSCGQFRQRPRGLTIAQDEKRDGERERDIQTESERQRHRETETETKRERQRETDKETVRKEMREDRQRQINSEADRDRETERERKSKDRQTER